MYDQYGLEFLLRGGQEPPPPGAEGVGGMPSGFNMGGMPGGGRSFHFSTNGGSGGFNPSDPADIFSSFFRGGGAGMGDDNDIFAQFLGGAAKGAGLGGSRGGQSRHRESNSGGGRRAATPEVTTVEKPLAVTLEELFKGTHKKMKIKRKTFEQGTNKRKVEDKILELDIRPGYKAGTKIKFKGVGDQEEGGTQDLHFIITEVGLLHRINICTLTLTHRKNTPSSNAKATTSAQPSNSISKKL